MEMSKKQLWLFNQT